MKLEIAKELLDAVEEQFFVLEENRLWDFAPVLPTDRGNILWSHFATTGMLYHAYQAGLPIRDLYRKVLDCFTYYRSKPLLDGTGIKYHSERGEEPNSGHFTCFFDDNIWVARNMLFAYEMFGETWYLEEAKRIVNYIYTGWNEELGGLVWNEIGLTEHGTEQELERGLSANACCIIVNARLYQLTGESSYLEWANRFYDFCKMTQDPVTKMYYNGIHTLLADGKRVAGAVNKDLYSYNPGSMILADLLLYEITKVEAYLEDAKLSAKAAHEVFLRKDEVSGVRYYEDFTWFLAILAEAYEKLKPYDTEAVEEYFQVFEESMNYALSNRRAGLLPHDFVTGWRADGDDYDRMILTHSGTVEIAFLLAKNGLQS